MRKASLYIFLVASVLTACSEFRDQGEPVAKVGEKVLTVEELSKNTPDYLDDTDSSLWADQRKNGYNIERLGHSEIL